MPDRVHSVRYSYLGTIFLKAWVLGLCVQKNKKKRERIRLVFVSFFPPILNHPTARGAYLTYEYYTGAPNRGSWNQTR